MSVALTPKQLARRDRSGRLLLEAFCIAADGDYRLAHRKLARAMLDDSCAFGVLAGLAAALGHLAEGPSDGTLRWEVFELRPDADPRMVEALTTVGAIVAAFVNGDTDGALKVFDTAGYESVILGAHELLDIAVVTAKAKAGEL